MDDAHPVEVIVDPFDFSSASFREGNPDGQGGAPSSAVALCLHGLTGTPYEVRSLGLGLAAAGIDAVGPVLPGHNETPEALSRVSHLDWLDAANSHYQTLRGRYERVFVVGLSMGGLLSLALAQRHAVDALVVVGTPLVLRQRFAWMIPLAKYFQPLPEKQGGSDIRDDAARKRHPSYSVMPLASVHELQRLQRVVRKGLPRIECPILVAHGAHDTTADPRDALAIVARVSSDVSEQLSCESSGHVVPVDVDAVALAERAAEFLTRFAKIG
jgi:carboxylesterase